MNNMKTIAFALVAVFALTTTVSAQPIAEYDPATGGVTFTDVADLVGLRINSAASSLIGGGLTDLDGAAAGTFGVVNDQAPDFVEFGNLTGLNFDSAFAGNLLPTGLQQADLEGDDTAIFLYRTSADPGTDVRGAFTGGLAIPEPTSLLLAGLGLMGFATSRRRS